MAQNNDEAKQDIEACTQNNDDMESGRVFRMILQRGMQLRDANQYVTKIPNDKVELFVGKDGGTWRSILLRSKARIKVIPLHLPPGDTTTERTLQIDGTNEQIEIAKQLINAVISGRNIQNLVGNPSMGGQYSQQGYQVSPPTSCMPSGPPMQRSGHGAPQPAAARYGQPAYAQPGYGVPPYGVPPMTQQGYGQQPPPYASSYGVGYSQLPPAYSAKTSQDEGRHHDLLGELERTNAALAQALRESQDEARAARDLLGELKRSSAALTQTLRESQDEARAARDLLGEFKRSSAALALALRESQDEARAQRDLLRAVLEAQVKKANEASPKALFSVRIRCEKTQRKRTFCSWIRWL